MTINQEGIGGPNRIVIDAEDLITALQNHDREQEYLLDRSTGEIHFLVDEDIVGVAPVELKRLIDEYPDRFVIIEPIEWSVAWRTMTDFIDQLPAGYVREKLSRALHNPKPFRSFKDVLLNYEDVRQNWFAYEYLELIALAREWLKVEGIEADLKIREPEGAS